MSAVSVRQTDVFRAALRVLTFRQRSLQKATCGRDVMISFSFACYHKHAMFVALNPFLNMEDSFLLRLYLLLLLLSDCREQEMMPGTL